MIHYTTWARAGMIMTSYILPFFHSPIPNQNSIIYIHTTFRENAKLVTSKKKFPWKAETPMSSRTHAHASGLSFPWNFNHLWKWGSGVHHDFPNKKIFICESQVILSRVGSILPNTCICLKRTLKWDPLYLKVDTGCANHLAKVAIDKWF